MTLLLTKKNNRLDERSSFVGRARSVIVWLICCAIMTTSFSIPIGCQKKSTIHRSDSTAIKDSAVAAAEAVALAAPIHNSLLLFNGGDEGAGDVSVYHSFRIPSIVKTNNGTLIAFAEGRRNSPSDYGDIDLVYKRSTDNGATWSALGRIAWSGAGTWGNPTAVYDWNKGANGRVWIFMNWNDEYKSAISDFTAWGDRKVYAAYSDDHGVSWSTPQDLTATLTPSDYKWDAMGPGIGIQTVSGDHPGRLIIPAYGRNIYSDDNGGTWQYQVVSGGKHESTIVELVNGTLLRNDRPSDAEWAVAKRRVKAIGSITGGFLAFSPDAGLYDPKCEGSIVRYNTPAPHRIIFLNPSDTGKRCNMTVRISYDEGVTWQRSRPVYDWNTCDYTPITIAKGGYSSMIKTADYAVGALIEINENVHQNATSSKSIEFHKFNLGWILNGVAEP